LWYEFIGEKQKRAGEKMLKCPAPRLE